MSKSKDKIHTAQVLPMPTPEPKHGRVVRDKREDSWQNIITGLGTKQDKRTGNLALWDVRTVEFYEQLYASDPLASRIVDLIPQECLRNWVDWTGIPKENQESVDERCQELGLRDAIQKTWIWARQYGGGCLHIVTDTTDPSAPLRIGERVIGLRDLSRWDLRILTTDIEYDFGSPNWGHPRIYYLNIQMGSQYKGYPIHWTRMIRFDGQLVPRRTFIRNNYWHDSVLNKLYNSIRNYQSSNDAAAAVLQDFNVDVYKMKNLVNLVSAGKEDIIKKRIELIQFSKSVLRAMILDSDDEDYENKGRSIEGVADLLRQQANRLVADTDIPHTKLLGESPDGSNATGNSTSQQWYNFLKSEQENYLRPKLSRLTDILFPDLRTKSRDPDERLGFKFRPLREMDDKEKAEIREKVANSDKTYIEAGVLDPTEVADSRFGGDEWTMETELDKDAREAGLIVPGQQEMDDPLSTTPPVESEGSEPGPSEPEPKQASKPVAGTAHDITGKESPEAQKPGTQFDFRNEEIPVKRAIPKAKALVSQSMSEPMRDPSILAIKGPGIPNKARTYLPTRGNGVTAPSGYDFEKDAGSQGESRESPRDDAMDIDRSLRRMSARKEGREYDKQELLPHEQESYQGTLNQTEKSLEEGMPMLGQHVPREGRAFSDDPKRAATIIVRNGDNFLMGKDAATGRWALPGGHIEKGESRHQGGLRELTEETGIGAKRLRFLGSRMVEPKAGENVEVHMYEHKQDDDALPDPKATDGEMNEWKWVSAKAPLEEEIANNLKHPNNVALAHLGLI